MPYLPATQVLRNLVVDRPYKQQTIRGLLINAAELLGGVGAVTSGGLGEVTMVAGGVLIADGIHDMVLTIAYRNSETVNYGDGRVWWKNNGYLFRHMSFDRKSKKVHPVEDPHQMKMPNYSLVNGIEVTNVDEYRIEARFQGETLTINRGPKFRAALNELSDMPEGHPLYAMGSLRRNRKRGLEMSLIDFGPAY